MMKKQKHTYYVTDYLLCSISLCRKCKKPGFPSFLKSEWRKCVAQISGGHN